jgi:2-amino-4-hydroxy-6-hydroxymethyldihydropteridine diphosphokinase
MPVARPVSTFVSLGANLGAPEATLNSAVHALRQLPGTQLLAVSSLYSSTAVGPAGQPDYLNAVAHLTTTLTPHALLSALQNIEAAHGRVRKVRWGARTLDLDVLLYGQDVITTASLVVPHAELRNRNFVVIPLLEVQPDLILPEGESLSSLPAAQNHHGLVIKTKGSTWAD